MIDIDTKAVRRKADESSAKFALGKEEDLASTLPKESQKNGARYLYTLSGLNWITKIPRVPTDPSKKGIEAAYILRHYQARDYKNSDSGLSFLNKLEKDGKIGIVIAREGGQQVLYVYDASTSTLPLKFNYIGGDGNTSSAEIDASSIIYQTSRKAASSTTQVVAVKPKAAKIAKDANQPAVVIDAQDIEKVEEDQASVELVEEKNEVASSIGDDDILRLPQCTEKDALKQYEFYLEAGFLFEAYKIAHRACVVKMQKESLGGANFVTILGVQNSTVDWETKKIDIVSKVRDIAFELEQVRDEYKSPAMPSGLVPLVLDSMVAFEGRCPRFLFSGAPGAGKTSWIQIIPYILGNPNGLIKIPCKPDMNYSDLVGGVNLKDGNTSFGEGGLSEAIRRAQGGEYGIVVYWAEVLDLPRGIMKSANNYFTQRMVDYASRGEKVHLRLTNGITLWDFADFNPKPGKTLDGDVTGSVRDRFVEIEFPFFEEAQIAKLLREKCQKGLGIMFFPSKELCAKVASAIVSLRAFVLERGEQLNSPGLRVATQVVDWIVNNPSVTPRQLSSFLVNSYIFEKVRLDAGFFDVKEECTKLWKQILPIGQGGEDAELDKPFSSFIPNIVEVTEE